MQIKWTNLTIALSLLIAFIAALFAYKTFTRDFVRGVAYLKVNNPYMAPMPRAIEDILNDKVNQAMVLEKVGLGEGFGFFLASSVPGIDTVKLDVKMESITKEKAELHLRKIVAEINALPTLVRLFEDGKAELQSKLGLGADITSGKVDSKVSVLVDIKDMAKVKARSELLKDETVLLEIDSIYFKGLSQSSTLVLQLILLAFVLLTIAIVLHKRKNA